VSIRRLLVLAAFAVPVVFGSRLAAQAWQPDSATCAAASDSVDSHVASSYSISALSACGSSGASALTRALGVAGGETDTAYLKVLTLAAVRLRSGDIADAALELAQNTQATPPARVAGIIVAVGQYSPSVSLINGIASWNSMAYGPSPTTCPVVATSNGVYDSTLPVPVDIASRVASAMSKIRDDAASPAPIRNLAGCARMVLKHDVPEIIAPANLAFTNLCGKTFKVLNSSSQPASLTYRVRGSSESGNFTALPGRELRVTAHDSGSVELLQSGTLLGTADVGPPCPL